MASHQCNWRPRGEVFELLSPWGEKAFTIEHAKKYSTLIIISYDMLKHKQILISPLVGTLYVEIG